MSTMSTNAGIEPRSKLLARLSDIPWLTVLPLAVAMALADGYWLISLRGAVGAIERSGHPTSSWLQESALALPIFVLAVIGALALANRWFASAPEKSKTLVLTALLVVVTGTLVGIAALVASSAYDYHLQSGVQHSMGSMGSMGSMASMGDPMFTGMTGSMSLMGMM